MELELVVSILSIGVFLIAAIDSFTNYRQWGAIKSLQKILNEKIGAWEERGDFGEQIGTWLNGKETPETPSNLEVMAAHFATAMFKTDRATIAGLASGEARLEKGIEKKVTDYLVESDPRLKDLTELADVIGIDPSHINILARVLNRVAPKMLGGGNNGRKDERFEY